MWRDLAVILALLALAVLALGSWRAMHCNFRYWRKTRRLPLILATPAQLGPRERPWRWSSKKWPPPGVPGAWTLSVEQSRAYSRLATLRARRWEAITLGANLLVAAYLSYLVTRLGAIHKAMDEAGAFDPDAPWNPTDVIAVGGTEPLWVTALGAGILIAATSNKGGYRDLAARYRKAAHEHLREISTPPDPSPSTSPPASPGLLRRIWEALTA